MEPQAARRQIQLHSQLILLSSIVDCRRLVMAQRRQRSMTATLNTLRHLNRPRLSFDISGIALVHIIGVLLLVLSNFLLLETIF